MLRAQGKNALQQQDREQAKSYFAQLLFYFPDHPEATLRLMETEFLLQNYVAAYGQARSLVRLDYPDERTALRIGIHCALEAANYPAAEKHCRAYLELYPEDQMIREIHVKLLEQTDLETLKLRFTRR